MRGNRDLHTVNTFDASVSGSVIAFELAAAHDTGRNLTSSDGELASAASRKFSLFKLSSQQSIATSHCSSLIEAMIHIMQREIAILVYFLLGLP